MTAKKLIGVMMLMFLLSLTALADWEFRRLQACGGPEDLAIPYGVSNDGRIVGWCVGFGDSFLWDQGEVTRLRVPGSSLTVAQGINTSGQVVGTYRLPDEGSLVHGFLWQQGVGFTTIDIPGYSTYPSAIRDVDGAVVGTVYNPPDRDQGFTRNADGSYQLFRAFGQSTSAYGGNNPDPNSDFRDYVVGAYYDSDGRITRGFALSFGIFTPFTYIDSDGPRHTVILGINDAVQSVGYYFTDYLRVRRRGFFLQPGNGGVFPLEFPGASDTFLSGINNDGLVVGYYEDGVTRRPYGFTACCAPPPPGR